MITADKLVPEESGLVALALAFAMSDELPVPIRQIMDPATTPAAFLPFLAAHRSVDLWFDDWPEARKRLMVAEAVKLAALKGTRAAAAAFLPFVDAEILDRISYPQRFVLGFGALGVTPIDHKPFTTHFLIKVPLRAPVAPIVLGQTGLGDGALQEVDLDPIRRVNRALVVSKSPETLLSADFAHRRPLTFGDRPKLDGTHRVGGWVDRKTFQDLP
ncbi:phage tail protein I [Antarcticirhabdus aurantiaca]|uniref:phage tail protein I n=1 Tax=Antarcticirhabdus aurantiaca TaxID=2606717 RepID=UPI001FF016F8|nr:phage tail protein I [Antarcticirhabdus aurantiaca]